MADRARVRAGQCPLLGQRPADLAPPQHDPPPAPHPPTRDPSPSWPPHPLDWDRYEMLTPPITKICSGKSTPLWALPGVQTCRWTGIRDVMCPTLPPLPAGVGSGSVRSSTGQCWSHSWPVTTHNSCISGMHAGI
ncbi:hypothetical protein AAFF_G00141480 [Aldrovandia affinis]|uniref:Uncharacterized protein n=1 Tax=Aldrovandia affinis TaxID=143900 RepID=A0AAD7X478_9TELE|nr:hypothetical protein AAFF_G00141480 [Aldrovandia affinis]